MTLNTEIQQQQQQKYVNFKLYYQRLYDGTVMSKECKKQEWSKQYTPGNPFQRSQWGDQRSAGRMMLKKIYRG